MIRVPLLLLCLLLIEVASSMEAPVIAVTNEWSQEDEFVHDLEPRNFKGSLTVGEHYAHASYELSFAELDD